MSKPPEGLPVHNFDSLLREAGLATVTMLRKHRREPAPGQRPVACYWTGHGFALLYRAAEAVDMPPLSPGRQRLYDAARTCADCGARSVDPWEQGRDKKRYCSTCLRPAAERLWRAERAADRPVIAGWARGVLDDPTAVLATQHRRQYWVDVLFMDVAGTVLLDAHVRWYARDPERVREQPELFAGSVNPREIAGEVAALAGRRLIAWRHWDAPELWIEWDERGEGAMPGPRVKSGDDLGSWWDRWVGDVNGGSYLYGPRLAQQPRPYDGRELLDRMRGQLAEMAAGAEVTGA